MTINPYKVMVKHDQGKISFKVMASSEQAAKQMVIMAESCPPCAIQSVKKLNLKTKFN